MIFDKQNELSDDQAVTATAASTNHINLGVARDIGKGTPIPFLIQVTTTCTAGGAATVVAAIQVDDNAAFTSAKTVAQTAAIPVASLVAGWQSTLSYVPQGTDEQYLRVYYTVATGPLTAGTFQAGVTMGNQTNT